LSISTSARDFVPLGWRPARARHKWRKPSVVTFQQLQKYEKGTNRISGGTLHELWRLLDTAVQFFFDGWVVSLAGAQQGCRRA
jgi:hypothetical protein